MFNVEDSFDCFDKYYQMPRVVYSLASDGLIFKWLSILMPRLKTPVTAALASGLFAGFNSLSKISGSHLTKICLLFKPYCRLYST